MIKLIHALGKWCVETVRGIGEITALFFECMFLIVARGYRTIMCRDWSKAWFLG